MIAELNGEHTIKLIYDQNGNHVIQKAIERVNYEHLKFIGEVIEKKAMELAGHPYGCRVVQRWLEHVPHEAKQEVLMKLDNGLSNLVDLQYGNYVAQAILQHGGVYRDKIIDTVISDIGKYSRQKFASNVVEKCMMFGSPEQQTRLMYAFVESSAAYGGLAGFIRDSFANYVIQKFLDFMSEPDFHVFVGYLQPEFAKARRSLNGKQCASLEKKMRRFSASQEQSPSDLNNLMGIPAGPAAQQFHQTLSRVKENDSETSAMSPGSDQPLSNDQDAGTATTPPPLISDAQSPQSSSLPSTTNSTNGDGIATTRPNGVGDKPLPTSEPREVNVQSTNPT